MLVYISLIIIAIIILYLLYHKKENLIDIPNTSTTDSEYIEPTTKKVKQTDEKNFVPAKYHQDYIDVITAFNNLSPNQRQVFNINNVPCKVSKNVDLDKVEKIISDFINNVNNEIKEHVPSVRSVNSGWDENLPEPQIMSGFEKVQKQLGLPISLYNKPIMKTNIKFISYAGVVKYETENEIKYTCEIVISKGKVKDDLVIQVSFVLVKGLAKEQVILEDITVLGFNTSQGLEVNRVLSDDLYRFDSLDKNNVISREEIAGELMKKYNLKRKIMQERIDGDYPEDREKYDTPSPATYDSYKVTQTIMDDMYGDKQFL